MNSGQNYFVVEVGSRTRVLVGYVVRSDKLYDETENTRHQTHRMAPIGYGDKKFAVIAR